VILTGALDHWPASSKWTLDYFAERWGDQTIGATHTAFPRGRAPYEARASDVHRPDSVRNCIAAMRSSDPDQPVYLNQNDCDSAYPGSRDDLRYDELVTDADTRKPNIWMGTRGTRSGLHWDMTDNLIAMFLGAKAFVLAPPGRHHLLYASHANPTKSSVDPAQVDWTRFPRLRRAELTVGVLRRGEILLLPRAWWHYFGAIELSINSSIWFGPLARIRMFQHFGPTHLAAFVGQLVWNGLLNQPYERRALSPAPFGVLAHRFVAAKLARRRDPR
jgi:lysine-specific demethylase 8